MDPADLAIDASTSTWRIISASLQALAMHPNSSLRGDPNVLIKRAQGNMTISSRAYFAPSNKEIIHLRSLLGDLTHPSLIDPSLPHTGSRLTKGQIIQGLIRARLPPYEFPSILQEECIKILNHATKSVNKDFFIHYRYDNSGNIVPLTSSQEETIKEQCPNTLLNVNSAIEIEAKEERNLNHDSNNNDCQCPTCQQINLLNKTEEEQTLWLELINGKGIDPAPTDFENYQDLQDAIIAASEIRENLHLREYWASLLGQMYTNLDEELDPDYRASDQMSKLMIIKQLMRGDQQITDYKNHLNAIIKRSDYQGRSTIKYVETLPPKYWEVHEELRVRSRYYVNFDVDSLYAPGQFEYMLQITSDDMYDASDEAEANLNSLLAQMIPFVLQKRADNIKEVMRLKRELEKNIILVDSRHYEPKEEWFEEERPPITWADEVDKALKIEPRSREMTQLARRVSQSGNLTGKVYFGVQDNGDLTSAKLKKAVLTFATKYLYEVIDERVYTYNLEFLTEEEFLQIQSNFNQKEEVETGNIEYKSTGSHMETRPEFMLPTIEKEWRVIELTVKRSTTQQISEGSRYSAAKRTIWGYPPLTLSDQEVRTPSAIASISRYREPCYKNPLWHKLTMTQKANLRAQDRYQIAKYEALGHTLQAITTGLIVARQVNKTKKGLRHLNLDNPNDYNLYLKINEIQKEVIRSWETIGWDLTNDQIKAAAAQLRVFWQNGRTELTETTRFVQLLIQYIDLLDPIYNDELITIMLGPALHYLTAYGMCVLGTLNRALPPPSQERADKEAEDTFNRFRTPFQISEEYKKDITEWSRHFFKDMPRPSEVFLASPGSAGCLERSRAEGGINSLISDIYQVMKGVDDLSKYPHLEKWRKRWISCPPLRPGNIKLHQKKNNEFAYAISLEICTPFLEHIETCPGPECTEKYKHFPLMPFGIPERGHKTRVPCLGSGFFNILQQPLRQALFSIIRDDPRCSYRAKGGEKREKLAKFLETMELSDLIHSGDLRVSTDNFSLEFNRAFVEGIYLTGKIDRTEYLILRAATGSFRILQENDDTSLKRRMAQPAMLYTLPRVRQEPPPPLTIAQQRLCKRSGWDDFKHTGPDQSDRLHQQIRTKWEKFEGESKNNLDLQKQIKFTPGEGHQAIKTDFVCLKCRSGPPLECYVLRKTGDDKEPITTKYVREDLGDHQKRPPKQTHKPLLAGFVREVGLRAEKPENPPPLNRDGEGLGYDLQRWTGDLESFESTFEYYFYKINKCLKIKGKDYLSKKGVQMSQAISIVTLYAFNLYADTKARNEKLSKGKSLICGDDALRVGNKRYIFTYRKVIEDLGGEWSKTKDVVGQHGNGIFTEQHFTAGQITDIPKIKAIARYDVDNIPAFLKAIQSVNKVEFPQTEAHPEIASQGRDEVLYPFMDQLRYISQIIPIGISKTFGGLGSKDYPLHWTTEEIYKSIQSVPDRQLAAAMLKKLTRCLHPRAEKISQHRKLKLHIDYPSEETSRFMREIGYLQGTHRWLYLEQQSLRSALEGAVSLEDPPMPVRFQKVTDEGMMLTHLEDVSQIRDLLLEIGVYPPYQNLNEERLIRWCYKFDVPRTIVTDIIGTLAVEENPYRINTPSQ
jgi:hypothetical protein